MLGIKILYTVYIIKKTYYRMGYFCEIMGVSYNLVSSPLPLPPFYPRQGGGLVSFVAFLGISIIFHHANPCDFETYMTTTCKSHVWLVNMALTSNLQGCFVCKRLLKPTERRTLVSNQKTKTNRNDR